MDYRLADNIFIKNSNTYQQSTPSCAIEFANSGFVKRIIPSASSKNAKVNTNSASNDDNALSTAKHPSLCLMSNKINSPVLQYKNCEEHIQYSNCLISYVDHPSAIFIQLLEDGAAFQQMHQDMNRYYMDNLHVCSTMPMNFFQIGHFCVAYSSQYFEFFRARILHVDYQKKQCLVIYVDFGNSEWVHIKAIRPMHEEFSKLKVQSIPVTLAFILPKKDLTTDKINWDTNTGKQCTKRLRRLLIKPDSEPVLFVSVTFLTNESWWPLPFVNIKIDGQNLAHILHNDGLARLTDNNRDLKMIYPDFGTHPNEHLIFGIERVESMIEKRIHF